MIKVNVNTQTVSREAIPPSIKGLDTYTLNHLQTELNPVPDDLIDIEYWNENPVATPFDAETQKLGDEILTIDVLGHVVDVSHEVVALTAQEMADNLSAAKSEKINELDSLFITKRDGGTVVGGDNVKTDHESIGTITSAGSLMGRNPTETIMYKLDKVWQSLSKLEVEALQDGVWLHVKNAAQTASDHSAAINALTTLQGISDYDISIGWPS